jgi:hypothetical protein
MRDHAELMPAGSFTSAAPAARGYDRSRAIADPAAKVPLYSPLNQHFWKAKSHAKNYQ